VKVNHVKYIPADGEIRVKETAVSFLTDAIDKLEFPDIVAGVIATVSEDGTVNIISDGDDMIVIMGLLAAAQANVANRYHHVVLAGDDDEWDDE